MPSVLYLIAMASFAANLSVRAIDPVIPHIADDLGVSIAQAAGLSAALAFTFAIVQPIIGAIADLVGKARVMVTCLGLLGVGSILGAFADTYPLLLATRIICGVGAGGVFPVTLSLTSDLVAVSGRQVAISRVLAGAMIGNILGSTLGGVVGGLFGWRGVLGFFGVATGVAAGGGGGVGGGRGRWLDRLRRQGRGGGRLPAGRQLGLHGVTGGAQVLRPLGGGETLELLLADAERRQAVGAGQLLQGSDVGIGVDGLFGERNAALAQQLAPAGAGLAIGAGVERDGVALRRLAQRIGQGGAVAGGCRRLATRRRGLGRRWRVGEGDAPVGADRAIDLGGGAGRQQAERQGQRCGQVSA